MKTIACAAALLACSLPLAAIEPLEIQDNSFFVEEAYNQEDRVVQHIFSYTRTSDGRYVAMFSQEWPAGGQKHQLSYGTAFDRRLGDFNVNYRYQLAGDGTTRLAAAPRLTAFVKGRGIQTNIPVSYALTDRVVTHWNAGATAIRGEKPDFNAGASLVIAARPKVHFMLESLWTREGWLVNPALRWAYNAGRLQIVPAVAVPVTKNSKSVLLYLSLEHPF